MKSSVGKKITTKIWMINKLQHSLIYSLEADFWYNTTSNRKKRVKIKRERERERENPFNNDKISEIKCVVSWDFPNIAI